MVLDSFKNVLCLPEEFDHTHKIQYIHALIVNKVADMVNKMADVGIATAKKTSSLSVFVSLLQ